MAGEIWWPYRNRPGDYWHNCRPSLMEFGCGQQCVNNASVANIHLRVSGITLENSPFWTFVLRGASDAHIDDVKVGASAVAPDLLAVEGFSCVCTSVSV
jgi:hypothetical protein